MKTLKIVLAIAGACVAIAAQAQTTTPKKPATKAEVKLPVAAPAPVAKEPELPAPPPVFSPVSLKEGAGALSYLPNEPQKVWEWVQEQLTGVPGKPDQFSSTEDRQKYDALVQQKMSSLGSIPLVSACGKKYDADSQSYEVKVLMNGIKDYSLKNPNPEALKLRRITLARANSTTSKYMAQNAYGASVEVFKDTADEYVAAFPAGMEPTGVVVPGNSATSIALPYSVVFNFLKLTVKMPPAEAREADKQIACIFVLTPEQPYTFRFKEGTRPTRDMPFESDIKGFGLFGKLEKLIVFNKVTGDVYAQASR